MPYLFQASIGPVQTFIASARRTRDLWFGSWLLSELAKAAAREIVERDGAQLDRLIFPAPNNAQALDFGSSLNVANKIVALVSRPPQEIGEAVERAIRERLARVRDQAFEQMSLSPKMRDIAYRQIDDMVECVWVGLPFADGEDYRAKRTVLDRLLAARKTTSAFAPVTWGSDQPKSSIDGRLESVIPADRYPHHKDSPAIKVAKITALLIDYGAGPAERLSGIDLLKRRSQGNQSFLSTSHVAALPFLERLRQISDQPPARALWDTYITALEQQGARGERISSIEPHPILGDCDGAMLFEERLNDEVEDTTRLETAKSALRGFLRFVNVGRPSPYYAILHADGDDMGVVIDREAGRDLERHRQLSRMLDRFATQAGDVITRHQGAPIYTGGDDVLALLPLHTAIECARELADAFKGGMQEFGNATLSAGLAIVHHLVPLSDALELARGAGRAAKKGVTKNNALAIILSKRGGGDTTVRGHWDEVDKWLGKLSEWHRNRNIPDGAAYELRDLALRMEGALPSDGLLKEALRILKRKRMAETALKELQAVLKRRMDMGAERPDHIITGFADELIVARIFADAADLAGLPLGSMKEAA